MSSFVEVCRSATSITLNYLLVYGFPLTVFVSINTLFVCGAYAEALQQD